MTVRESTRVDVTAELALDELAHFLETAAELDEGLIVALPDVAGELREVHELLARGAALVSKIQARMASK